MVQWNSDRAVLLALSLERCLASFGAQDAGPLHVLRAVTSTLYKLFMRLVTYRLQLELGRHKFGQMAGIQGAQVHDFATALDMLARKSREWRFPAYLLSWDLAKAFDSLEWSAVLDLCKLRGVSPEIECALLHTCPPRSLTSLCMDRLAPLHSLHHVVSVRAPLNLQWCLATV